MDAGSNCNGKGVEQASEAENLKEKVCKRCKQQYTASSNSPNSCRFHPSFFVCRRHDDQKRYYELGPDDPPYAAKFYDCCGAEDTDAPPVLIFHMMMTRGASHPSDGHCCS